LENVLQKGTAEASVLETNMTVDELSDNALAISLVKISRSTYDGEIQIVRKC
jgi:hypothetical protein